MISTICYKPKQMTTWLKSFSLPKSKYKHKIIVKKNYVLYSEDLLSKEMI